MVPLSTHDDRGAKIRRRLSPLRPRAADQTLDRVEVWTDGVWRLTMALRSEVLGFSYPEPLCDLRDVEDLDGDEKTLGAALSLAATALGRQIGAERVYVCVFAGSIAHLHFHLAPHLRDHVLSTQILRGEFEERALTGPATEVERKDFPVIDREELLRTAASVAELLRDEISSDGSRVKS